MNSFDHYSFGAVCEWMINDLAGIQSGSPCYGQIIIHPHPPTPGSDSEHQTIHWVKAHYDSIHGRIVSNWRQTADKFELETILPANTTATVYLAASSADQVTESGHALAKSKDAKFLRTEGGHVVVAVEFGEYHFACPASQ